MTKELIREADKTLGMAIDYNKVVYWRLYKQAKNKASKWLEKAKKLYFNEHV